MLRREFGFSPLVSPPIIVSPPLTQWEQPPHRRRESPKYNCSFWYPHCDKIKRCSGVKMYKFGSSPIFSLGSFSRFTYWLTFAVCNSSLAKISQATLSLQNIKIYLRHINTVKYKNLAGNLILRERAVVGYHNLTLPWLQVALSSSLCLKITNGFVFLPKLPGDVQI